MSFAPVPTNTRISYDRIPVQQKDRNYTDCICTIITAVLAIVFFIFAIIAIAQSTGPFPYSQADDSSFIGLLTKNNLAAPSRPGDVTNFNIDAFLTSRFWTVIISISLGLLWMAFAQILPTYAPRLAPALALLALVAVIVFAFVLNSQILVDNTWLRWVIAIVALLAAIFIAYYLIFFPVQMQIQGTFLRNAARFISERPLNILYAFVWIILYNGLFALVMFQQYAYSLHAHKNNNPYDYFNPYFWGVVNFLELLLGIQFLQDAFIFIISGNAVDWYWKADSAEQQPNLGLANLVRHNWGSVVVGSYLNLFLRGPLLVLEFLVCHPRGCCKSLGVCCHDNSCTTFLNLIRTDSYAYTNIFGTAYCGASFECTRLCNISPHFTTSQSPLRNYRIISTIFLTLVAFILGHIIFNARVQPSNFWFALNLLLIANAIVSNFVSLGASAAEGLMTSTQVELDYLENYDYLQKCHSSVRKELKEYSKTVARQPQI